MANKPTAAEIQRKALMERFIKCFEARMAREKRSKYQLIPIVAVELERTTRTIEHWVSRSGANPKDILVVRSVENWCEKEEDQ